MENKLREQIVNIIANNCSRRGFDEYTRSADQILTLFKPMTEEEISLVLYQHGVLMNYSDDRKRVAHALYPHIPQGDDKFIAHIQAHLKLGEEVVCKICGKTAKEIVNEKL